MGTVLSTTSITNNIVSVSVGANMRVTELKRGGVNIWAKTMDTVHYTDTAGMVQKSVVLKKLAWSINAYTVGQETFIQGLASYLDVDGITLSFDFIYSINDGSDVVHMKVDVQSDSELKIVRGVHYGRAFTNLIARDPRVVFQRGVEIEYMDSGADPAIVWSGDILPGLSLDPAGGDSVYAMAVTVDAGVRHIEKQVAGEDWSGSRYLMIMVNARSLSGTGQDQRIRLYWVSNSVKYYTGYRTIDIGEVYKINWRLYHLRYFYLDQSDRSNVTAFGIEFSGGGGHFIIDDIWRYDKDDYLPDYAKNSTNYYDILPFFNSAVPWDRRQAEEGFVLSYADERAVGGDLLGVAWIGHWSRTSDIVTVELDKSSNSKPLAIGGHLKYLTVGLDGKHWQVDWYLMPMVAGTAVDVMYGLAESFYNGLISKGYPLNSGVGQYAWMPYIWPAYDDPVVDLAPALRRVAAAGITDLILPMGNNGWHAFKPRNWRFDCANVVKEKADDRLEFVIRMWLDPAFPERRVHLEATIFDNHWLKDNRDEVTTGYDMVQAEDRMFVYAEPAGKELYIQRGFEPVDAAWFSDQVVGGVTYSFSYQYPRFRPSLAHVVQPAAEFGKSLNLHDRLLKSIGEVCATHDFTSIVLSEYFWYRRGFDAASLDMFNSWRLAEGLPVLDDFDRLDNGAPASVDNFYKADDMALWQWKASELNRLTADIRQEILPCGKLLWVNSNVDNVIGVKDINSNLWQNVGMVNGVPVGRRSLQWGNKRHGTGFEAMNDNSDIDFIWFWNYWGYSRVEAVMEFIKRYCSKKEKVIMALGIYPMSGPPGADEFYDSIINARTYGFRLSFPGHRNYTEAHWQALENGLAAVIKPLACPVRRKKPVLGERKESDFIVANEWDRF